MLYLFTFTYGVIIRISRLGRSVIYETVLL